MSSSYAGLNTYHASVVIPSDGDPAIAESVNASLRALTDDAVYLNTQLGHQAFDDRGKTSTITGAIRLNNGGGSVDFQLPVTCGDTVQFNDAVTITGSLLAGDAQFNGDVTLGNQSSDAITVLGALTVGDAQFNGNVVLGNQSSDAITITGTITAADAQFNGNVQIGNQSSDTALIKSRLTIDNSVTTTGSYEFGDSSSDTGTLNGSVEFVNDVTIDGTLDVFGDLTTRSTTASNTIRGNTTFQQPTTLGDVAINGDATIGNQSSDHLTINSAIIAPVTFSGAGRIPERQAPMPDQAGLSFTVSDGELFVCNNLTAARGYLVSDAGAVDGDTMTFYMIIYNHAAGVTLPSGHQGVLQADGAWMTAKRINGTWYWLRTQVSPPAP